MEKAKGNLFLSFVRLHHLSGRKGFLGGLVVKNLPAMQETLVRSLGWEDPQEEGMATHSSILAWGIPWTRAWRAPVCGLAKSWTRLSTHADQVGETVSAQLLSKRSSTGPGLGWFIAVYAALKSDGYQGNTHSTGGEAEKGSVG